MYNLCVFWNYGRMNHSWDASGRWFYQKYIQGPLQRVLWYVHAHYSVERNVTPHIPFLTIVYPMDHTWLVKDTRRVDQQVMASLWLQKCFWTRKWRGYTRYQYHQSLLIKYDKGHVRLIQRIIYSAFIQSINEVDKVLEEEEVMVEEGKWEL